LQGRVAFSSIASNTGGLVAFAGQTRNVCFLAVRYHSAAGLGFGPHRTLRRRRLRRPAFVVFAARF